MSFWTSVWGWTLGIVLTIYAILVLAVAIGGYGDLLKLWRRGRER